MDHEVKRREFLEKLAALCDEYRASFYYTIDDDGVHIGLDDLDVFTGHLANWSSAGDELRKAI